MDGLHWNTYMCVVDEPSIMYNSWVLFIAHPRL